MKPVKLEQDESTDHGQRRRVFRDVRQEPKGSISQIVRDGVNLLDRRRRTEAAPVAGPAPQRRHVGLQRLDRCGTDRPETQRRSAWPPSSSAPAVGARRGRSSRPEGKSGFSVTHSALYTIYGDGSIAVDNAVMPQGRRIPLARMGVRHVAGQAARPVHLSRPRADGELRRPQARLRRRALFEHRPRADDRPTPSRWNAAITRTSAGRRSPATGCRACWLKADGGPMQVSALPYTDEVMTPDRVHRRSARQHEHGAVL